MENRQRVRWKSQGATWSRLKTSARENRKGRRPAEAKLWEYLRVERIRGYKFRRQHAVGPYIVDFYCAAAKLVIEVDGPIHNRQVGDAAIRTTFLEQMGLRVIRVTNEQVLNKIDLTRDFIFNHLSVSPSPPCGEGD